MKTSLVTVSIVIPCRNEEALIGRCLDSLLANDYPKSQLEVLVVDGMSTDRTREVAKSYAQRHPFIRVVENPNGTTPAGMNLGIRMASGKVIVIASAHSEYPPHFISKSVEWLERTGSQVVGGPLVTVPGADTVTAKLIALASSHRFGVGNSKFRTSFQDEYVDTVPFGAYRREVFVQTGLFDERLERNQDNELCSRIIRGGGRIFMTRELTASYYSRATLAGFIRQAFRNGMWNVLTIRITPAAFRWRHFIPFFFVTSLLVLGTGSALLPWCRVLLPVLLCSYAVAALIASVDIGSRAGMRRAALLPIFFFLLHVSYGIGTWCGAARLAFTQWGVANNPKTNQLRSPLS